MSEMQSADNDGELAARVARNVAWWQAKVESYFGYLRAQYGFRIAQTDSLWAETYIIYQSDKVAIKVTRSLESNWVETELIRLVDGAIPDGLVFVNPDEPIDRFHLETLLRERAPQLLDELKSARGLGDEQVERSLALQARAVEEYAADILSGDLGIFATLDQRVKQHVKEHPQTLTIHIPDDAPVGEAEQDAERQRQQYPGVIVTVKRYRRNPASVSSSASTSATTSSTAGAVSLEQRFPADLYEMTVGMYKLFKFNQITCALIGAIAAFLSLYLLAGGFLRQRMPVIFLYPLTTNAMIILTALAIGGIVTLITSLRARGTIVLADRRGMRKRWLLADTFIPWEQVREVAAFTINGRPRSYRIGGLTDQGKNAVIRWPGFPFDPSPKPQETGAVLTNPRDMAAIAVARSGKPLITR